MNKLENIERQISNFMERNIKEHSMDKKFIESFIKDMTVSYSNNYSVLLQINKKKAFELFENDLKKGNPVAIKFIPDFFNIVLSNGYNLRLHHIIKILKACGSRDLHLLLLATDLDKLQQRSYDRGLKCDFRVDILNCITQGDFSDYDKSKMINELFEFNTILSDKCIAMLLKENMIEDKTISSLSGCSVFSAEKLIRNNKVDELFFAYRDVDEEEYINNIKSERSTY